ncbi:MAG: hypothetical protein MHM6MM_001480 [Cercozoa sp. M6MM]
MSFFATLRDWYRGTGASELEEAEQSLIEDYQRVHPQQWENLNLRRFNVNVGHEETETMTFSSTGVFDPETFRLPSCHIHTLEVRHDDDDAKEDDEDDVPIVLAHGFGAGAAMYLPVLPQLAKRSGRRVFALDWLGFGLSARPDWLTRRIRDAETALLASEHDDDEQLRESEQIFVEALEQWRQRVLGPNKRMILCGHSLGGYLASHYAMRYEHNVEKLVLISPAGVKPPLSSEQREERLRRLKENVSPLRYYVLRTMQKVMTQVGSPLEFLRWCPSFIARRLVDAYVNGRFTQLNETREAMRQFVYHTTMQPLSGESVLHVVLDDFAQARRPLLRSLPGLQRPTLFIYGDNDWMEPGAVEPLLESHGDVFSRHIVPQVGHQVFLNNPRGFLDAMHDFVFARERR